MRLAITATVCAVVLLVAGLLVFRFVVLQPQPLHSDQVKAVPAP